MGAEQLLFDPEEAGWLVHEVDGGEVVCQPVGKDLAEPVDNVQTIVSFDVSREKGEPGDEDGEILTSACGAVYSCSSCLADMAGVTSLMVSRYLKQWQDVLSFVTRSLPGYSWSCPFCFPC